MTHVPVTREMLRDGLGAVQSSLHQALARAAARALDEAKYGPTLGPRRVLNDAQQAEEDRRHELAGLLLELADEWGVYDLVAGDEW